MLKINDEIYDVLSANVDCVNSTYNKRKGYSYALDISIKHNNVKGYVNVYIDFFLEKNHEKNIANKKYAELPTELNSKIDCIEIFDTRNFIDCIDSEVYLEFGSISDGKIKVKLDIDDELIRLDYDDLVDLIENCD